MADPSASLGVKRTPRRPAKAARCGPQPGRPRLLLRSDAGSQPEELSPWGAHATLNGEHFQGTLFFAHRPPRSSGVPLEYESLLGHLAGAESHCELQVQGRFKAAPTGRLFMSLELQEGPMKIGPIASATCRAVLALGDKLFGGSLRHSFGFEGDRPMLGLPLLSAGRVLCSPAPLPLPLAGPKERGAWSYEGGEWVAIDKSKLTLDSERYFTFVLPIGILDFTTWTSRIPGLGNLNLQLFWGLQAVHCTVFEEEEARQGEAPRKRCVFDLEVVPPFARREPAVPAEPTPEAVQLHLPSQAASPQAPSCAEEATSLHKGQKQREACVPMAQLVEAVLGSCIGASTSLSSAGSSKVDKSATSHALLPASFEDWHLVSAADAGKTEMSETSSGSSCGSPASSRGGRRQRGALAAIRLIRKRRALLGCFSLAGFLCRRSHAYFGVISGAGFAVSKGRHGSRRGSLDGWDA